MGRTEAGGFVLSRHLDSMPEREEEPTVKWVEEREKEKGKENKTKHKTKIKFQKYVSDICTADDG